MKTPGAGTGQDCDTVCSGLGRTCDEQAFTGSPGVGNEDWSGTRLEN